MPVHPCLVWSMSSQGLTLSCQSILVVLLKASGWVCQVEGFDEVERAFVHVDYERRNEPEHKARPLSGQCCGHRHSMINAAKVCCPVMNGERGVLRRWTATCRGRRATCLSHTRAAVYMDQGLGEFYRL